MAPFCPGRMAEHPKSKSTGGFNRPDVSPCVFFWSRLTHRRRVAADEEDRDGDEDDAQLVLLALLLEEPDLRTADQCEEREGMGVGVLSRVSARGLILLAWQSGLCITLTTTIIIKVINM